LLSAILLWGQWLAIRAKLWRLEGRFNKLQAKTGKMTAESAAQHDHDQQRYGQQGESAASNQLTADRRLS
jgi:predicted secreted Zn-dependent protease